MTTPSVWKRLASALYDALLLLAVLIAANAVFVSFFGKAEVPPLRYFHQVYLYLICATYFVGFWQHGGQTLAMRTWHIKLVSASGAHLGVGQVLLRFVLAPLGLLLFWWAWLDKERCFLHDRLAKTRLVKV